MNVPFSTVYLSSDMLESSSAFVVRNKCPILDAMDTGLAVELSNFGY
jgi:hypothetical protein